VEREQEEGIGEDHESIQSVAIHVGHQQSLYRV